MVAAIITAGAGLLGILLTVLSQWFGPRTQRQLMALELDLLAKVKDLEPGDSVQKQLLAVIEDRAINWATFRSAPMIAVRAGAVISFFGIVLRALDSFAQPPNQSTQDEWILFGGWAVIVFGGVLPMLWALRRTKARSPRGRG